MTVGDLQKCLRALADAIGAAKGVNKDLEEAASALTPFAAYKMPAFAAFLKLAEEKYAATGTLPDAKPPKQAKAPAAPKPPKPTPAGLAATINDLKARLARNEPLDRAAVAARIGVFEKLTKAELESAVRGLGYQDKPKSKADALTVIVNNILAAATAAARADV